MPTIKRADGSDMEIDRVLYALAWQVVNVHELVDLKLMAPAENPPSGGGLNWFKEVVRIAEEASMPEPTEVEMDKAYVTLRDDGKAGVLTPLGRLHFNSADTN